MVGGLRHVRYLSGFDPKALELEEIRRKKEKRADYNLRMVRGMAQAADESLARGDIYQYAEINFGIMIQTNPKLDTPAVHAMTLEYLTGLPYYQNFKKAESKSKTKQGIFAKLYNHLVRIFGKNKTQLSNQEEKS